MTEFTWVMAVQNGTAGFDLLVQREEALQPINDELIRATEPDSFVPQLYEYTAPVEEDTYYLREISIGGVTTLHGPFTRGESFGENPFAEGDQSVRVFLPLVSSTSLQQ